MKRSMFVVLAGLAVACGDDAVVPAETDTDAGTGTAGTADGPSTLDETAGACAEPFEIECAPDQSIQCVGPSTPVTVEAPVAACDQWDVLGTPPTELPPGEHPVAFELEGEGMTALCTTVVTVVDDDAPFINCPDSGLVLRPSPEVEAMVPMASADDLCWDTLDISADPPVLGPGITTVEYTATDGSGNSVSCTSDLEVVDVFAVEGFRLIAGELTEAGETEITLAWEPSPAAPVTGYRVETALAEDGPWDTVGVVAGDEQLLTTTLGEPSVWFRVVTESELGDGGITQARRAFTVGSARDA